MSTSQTFDLQKTVCVNPATGDIVGYSQMNTPEEAREAVRRARAAQPAWAALPLEERVRYMLRLRDYLVDHVDDVSATISKDVGKTRVEALATEVLPSAMATDYYAKNARRFLQPRKVRAGSLLFLNKRSRIFRIPFGVIGIIAPWNYPLGIPMHEIVPALLAGNTVIFKTAPETQMVGRKIEEMIQAAGLPADVFTHLNIPGAIIGQILLEPDHHVDKLFFTGSVPVGKTLMAKAAESLTPVSLELGGNDPMLVCPDAHLARAVNGAMWAGLQNSGQSCGGVERVYVHQDVYEPFIQLLKQRVEALRQGPNTHHNVDIGAMCTERQIKTIQRQVDDALAKGATLLAQVTVDSAHTRANFYPVTVLTNVDHTMELMREETFGPVLGVMKVRDMEQAIELANDSSLGLTGSVWSRKTREAVALGRRIHAGVITINDHLLTHGMAETPWGGVKESGIGRSHGELGFDEMTQPQVVTTELLHFAKRNLFWHPYDEPLYEGLKGALNFLHGREFSIRLRGLIRFAGLIPRMFKD
ncbi:MAG TPA: aldehyde dehydrogenase family protein [Candidatus Competibacteraceae bacterium]|nr:aldehyde dehydrogenase family protein [Candidatus Competibacteraceae bacterium]HSA47996.1 aldehyde dehydrogenase family protein [Candidatus Competibacteraceae bacterium]